MNPLAGTPGPVPLKTACLAICWVLLGSLAAARQDLPRSANFFQLTPDSVSGGTSSQRVGNPIAYALERAGPGSVLQLSPGAYPPFSIGLRSKSAGNARASGQPGRPITIEGQGGVVITSGQGGADTILIAQQVPTAHIVFRNLTIQTGYRAGVMFARGGVHVGFRFHDCNIEGGFNHLSGRGRKSKWGIWGSQLQDFEFKGVFQPAVVRNIRDEHGFYLQNSQGDITIENVRGEFLGRTFCQFTSRSSEGSVGVGTITIKNCKVRDIGLAPGDAHKGGAAFTFGGGHNGTIRIEKCEYLCGFDRNLKRLTNKGSPYGTGALVMITHGAGPTRRLILKDNRFQFNKDSGDRPVVSIGGCRDLQILGGNRFVAGAYEVALELDPVQENGSLRSPANGKVQIAMAAEITGRVEVRGKPATEAELARLRGGP